MRIRVANAGGESRPVFLAQATQAERIDLIDNGTAANLAAARVDKEYALLPAGAGRLPASTTR
jgi:hypothetical protein